MFEILKTRFRTRRLKSKRFVVDSPDTSNAVELPLLQEIDRKTRKALGRSLLIRHLDAGSCNAEEAEMMLLSGPLYDMSRFGLEMTASPRHADILTVSGPVARHLLVAMQRTYEAMPNPKIVVAIGDGACFGGSYDKTYACLGRVDQYLPVDFYIPGDPPSPREILEGLLQCKALLLNKAFKKRS